MSSNDFFLFDMDRMERIELFDGIIFGRDDSCDVILYDEMVSGSHLKIVIIDYQVYVIDLESSNKTFINDVAIISNKKFVLNPKDVIRVGSLEFAYSSGAIRKLDLPSLSQTMKIDNVLNQESSPDIERISSDSMFSEDDVYSGDDQLAKVEILQPKERPVVGLKSLKVAKKYLDELVEINQEVFNKIEHLKKMRKRKIDVGAKIDKLTTTLQNSKCKTEKDFQNELRIHRGTIEGFRMKIKKEEIEILKAKKIIQEAKDQISQAQFNIAGFNSETTKSKTKLDNLNNEFDTFKNQGIFKNELESLKNTISTYEQLDLENKKNEVDSEIKLKTKQYKDMQNHYGAKLNSDMIRKKAASE